MIARKLKIILDMIKFEHTIFALPFAIMSAFVASDGLPAWDKIGWILVAMVGARSCAMAFNRLADAKIDKANPRTAIRAIPTGKIGKKEVWVFTLVSAALLVFAAYKLNRLAFALSPVALAVIMGYSYTKRFTSLSHLWLGISLSIAPIGAWIAIKGRFDWTPMLIGLAVLLWTTGFDIIYACQDLDFDRRHGLYSLTGFGILYLVGVGIVSIILIYEHVIVKPNDLSRVNLAFFTLNGMVSLVLMALSVADILF